MLWFKLYKFVSLLWATISIFPFFSFIVVVLLSTFETLLAFFLVISFFLISISFIPILLVPILLLLIPIFLLIIPILPRASTPFTAFFLSISIVSSLKQSLTFQHKT